MPLLTHTGRPFLQAAYSPATRRRTAAANVHLTMIKRCCLIMLTSLLAIGAVGGIIALKTVAVLARFTH